MANPDCSSSSKVLAQPWLPSMMDISKQIVKKNKNESEQTCDVNLLESLHSPGLSSVLGVGEGSSDVKLGGKISTASVPLTGGSGNASDAQQTKLRPRGEINLIPSISIGGAVDAGSGSFTLGKKVGRAKSLTSVLPCRILQQRSTCSHPRSQCR